ncbi:hypothetical protein [Pyrococcus kukulkanii]|uniref:Uncharacterized protein n=1 Tax=Pyrococcus kukulkanii TaxID=1609559 RepID=A0A127B8W3_9EURY|nr:hypothetical protein [Pyrococcus kukulkanii]AMM53219.1 hypothetical protein TQ32_00945 [Pyrococcus kukulkanii]
MLLVLIGIILGGIVFVYGFDIEKTTIEKCNVQTLDKPSFERAINTTLPTEISNYLVKQVGIKTFKHVGTLSKDSLHYSVIEVKDQFPPKAYYVVWDKTGVKKFGELKFKVIKESSKSDVIGEYTILTIYGKKKVKVIAQKSFKVAEVDNVKSLKTIKVVLAEYVYIWTWVGEKDTLTKTGAKGKFWVDYGNKIVDVDDLSWEYHDMKVGLCSFSHHTDDGPLSAGVYADAHYHLAFRHFDSHPRVFVNAWAEVDFDGYGNKWNGKPSC